MPVLEAQSVCIQWRQNNVTETLELNFNGAQLQSTSLLCDFGNHLSLPHFPYLWNRRILSIS